MHRCRDPEAFCHSGNGSLIVKHAECRKEHLFSSPVPEGAVTGTLTADGETRQVTGSGYHDHNWGNVSPPIYSTTGGGGAAESAPTRSSPLISVATPL